MELPFFTSGSSNSATTRAEALRWLAIAEKLLAGRDLVGSKSFAARARESDPSLLYADQIIAVADTLLAGDKRINNQQDWYSILQLAGHQTHDSELIASQYRKLALLLNPQKNKLPYADHAFNLVVNAWSVLSNPSRKNLYDNELMSHLGVNSVSSGFNPITTGVSREHVNFQPFEINFQVMPQHQHQHQHQHQQQQQQQQGMVREQVSQPLPQHAMTREQMQMSQQLPQQNVSREPVSQPLSQQNLSREQVRQPKPKPQQAQPQPQPQTQTPPPPPPPPQVQQQVQPQPQTQAQPQQRKDYWMGSNVTHNFTGTFENSNANSNNNDNVSENTNNVTENVGNSGVNSGVRGDERRLDDASDDGDLSFWTACPYCYYMYEYPTVYAECALKCQNCKKAFQAVAIPSPPPIVEGQEAYFCCWGLMPLGVSMNTLEKNKGRGGSWTPFSPMFTCPQGFGKSGGTGNANNFRGWNANNVNNNVQRSRGGNVGGRKHSTPRVYVDDDDVFVEISGSSEESDDDWQNNSSQKRKKTTKGVKRNVSATPSKSSRKFQVDKGKNVNGGGSDSVQVLQEGVEVPSAAVAESSKKGAAVNTRRQSARVANFGKLDLNVELSNEAEEPVRRGNQGNGAARGEEDIIEGGGFFEGLDEFLSSLPILNVVGDDKVKAA